ncbi:MAG: hypothetical protein HYT29_01125 [Parcubacteria group bacterium]|nr:hypothetical protein [Parcubacteria group bacterium]
MFDLKAMNAALDQLETERGIPKEKIIEAIADALAAAYKKDYGKRGQIVRATFDPQTGDVSFVQVKTVVDETLVKMEEEPDTNTQIETNDTNKKGAERKDGSNENAVEDGDVRVRWNPEHHILIEDARKMKKDAIVGEEIVFPLETKKDYGRIAAQVARRESSRAKSKSRASICAKATACARTSTPLMNRRVK